MMEPLRDQGFNRAPRQFAPRVPKDFLGGLIGVADPALIVDQQDGVRQGLQDLLQTSVWECGFVHRPGLHRLGVRLGKAFMWLAGGAAGQTAGRTRGPKSEMAAKAIPESGHTAAATRAGSTAAAASPSAAAARSAAASRVSGSG